MPTEIEENGFQVMIYTRNEHEPPHVHVWKGSGEAIINLGGEKGGYPELYDVNEPMSKKDAYRALEIVTRNNGFLIKRWREIWRTVHD
jgi:hypothetical protein